MLMLCIVLCSILLIVLVILLAAIDGDESGFAKFLTVIAIYLFVGVVIWLCLDQGYKSGQIDYATGKVKYKLEKQSDGTVTWEKVRDK